MFVGYYESVQNRCHSLEHSVGPRIFLTHVLAQVIPDVSQHSPYLDRVVRRIALPAYCSRSSRGPNQPLGFQFGRGG